MSCPAPKQLLSLKGRLANSASGNNATETIAGGESHRIGLLGAGLTLGNLNLKLRAARASANGLCQYDSQWHAHRSNAADSDSDRGQPAATPDSEG